MTKRCAGCANFERAYRIGSFRMPDRCGYFRYPISEDEPACANFREKDADE